MLRTNSTRQKLHFVYFFLTVLTGSLNDGLMVSSVRTSYLGEYDKVHNTV